MEEGSQHSAQLQRNHVYFLCLCMRETQHPEVSNGLLSACAADLILAALLLDLDPAMFNSSFFCIACFI